MSFRKHKRKGATRVSPTRRIEGCTSPSDTSIDPRHVSARRARVLRRCGVYVERCGAPGRYVWYETCDSWLRRKMQRDITKALRKAIRGGPIYWSDAGLALLKDGVAQTIVDRMRLYPGEALYDIRTATGYQLDVLGRVQGESDEALRARVSPRLVLTIPGIIDTPIEGFEADKPFVFESPRLIGAAPELGAPFGPNKVMSREELERRYGKPIEPKFAECLCGCYSGGCGRPDGCRCGPGCPCHAIEEM